MFEPINSNSQLRPCCLVNQWKFSLKQALVAKSCCRLIQYINQSNEKLKIEGHKSLTVCVTMSEIKIFSLRFLDFKHWVCTAESHISNQGDQSWVSRVCTCPPTFLLNLYWRGIFAHLVFSTSRMIFGLTHPLLRSFLTLQRR